MIQQCEHILDSGQKCCAAALRGKRHCRHHSSNCRRRLPRPYVRQTRLLGPLPELNTQEAVHTIISEVVRLSDGSISVCRAQALITSLQLASKTLRAR